MVPESSLLVTLVGLVDRIPTPPAPRKRGRGRPRYYADRLFLKALVIMIVKHLHSPYELSPVLQQNSAEMAALRQELTQAGRYPTRRTFERRLATLPDQLSAQIGCLGCHLVRLLQPWAEYGRAIAADSTVLRAKGGVWHKKHRDAGEVPHTSIDTEAHWTKSGWHGWVYGWKLHLVTVVAAVWIPLAADLTPANVADNEHAPALLETLPPQVRFVLGDQHYNDPALRDHCAAHNRVLVTTKRGSYPHRDEGVEVR